MPESVPNTATITVCFESSHQPQHQPGMTSSLQLFVYSRSANGKRRFSRENIWSPDVENEPTSPIDLTLKVDVMDSYVIVVNFVLDIYVKLEKKKKNAGKYGSYYQKFGRVLCM